MMSHNSQMFVLTCWLHVFGIWEYFGREDFLLQKNKEESISNHTLFLYGGIDKQDNICFFSYHKEIRVTAKHFLWVISSLCLKEIMKGMPVLVALLNMSLVNMCFSILLRNENSEVKWLKLFWNWNAFYYLHDIKWC